MKVQIFADGADREQMMWLYANPIIQGFTTNPSLMRKAGITNYESFAREILSLIPDRPISFEVFSDDHDDMMRQARLIGSWGPNVNVKIPITDTGGRSTIEVIRALAADGIKLNVTACMTPAQVEHVLDPLAAGPPCYVSVFAGRVADTGRDPVPLMKEALDVISSSPNIQLIWASPRELLNIFQADEIGCHVITVTADVLNKMGIIGKDLDQYSLETVQMFHDDAEGAGFGL
jgi:transaldolase